MTTTPRTWVVGEVVTAAYMNTEIRDQFNSFFGAWTSFTPTWTASTTNPSLGNGTLVGRYLKIGRTVICHINLIPGSTTTYGSGTYSFNLPATAANSSATYIGSAHLLGGSRWAGQFVISPGASAASPFFSTSATSTLLVNMDPNSPEVFGSGDQLRMTIAYEAAS